MEKNKFENVICYDMKMLKKLVPLGANKLYELVNSEGFPKIKVGRRILIPKTALEKWLAENASLGKIV